VFVVHVALSERQVAPYSLSFRSFNFRRTAMLFELLFAAPENIGFNPPDGIEYLMFVAFFFFIFFCGLLKESDLPYRFFWYYQK
jgi:hypothetical protein